MPTQRSVAVPVYKAYEPRTIKYGGIHSVGPWRFRRYAIQLGADVPQHADFGAGIALALRDLPAVEPNVGRPGVGFLITHAGRGADYVVLGWWDRENELPLRVVVRDQMPGAAFRLAGQSESVCVWDLQVIAAEREAYVNTVLAGVPLSEALEHYLAAVPLGAVGEQPDPARLP